MKWLCHFEVPLYGGSPSMTPKDWNPTYNTNIKEVKKGLVKAAKEEIALKWLPLEVLLSEAEGKVIKVRVISKALSFLTFSKG